MHPKLVIGLACDSVTCFAEQRARRNPEVDPCLGGLFKLTPRGVPPQHLVPPLDDADSPTPRCLLFSSSPKRLDNQWIGV